MIIALYCVAAAMVLGGSYFAISGWEIVIIERGWTQVLSGVFVATGGVLLAGIAFLAGEIRQMTTRLTLQPATEASSSAISRPSVGTDESDGKAPRADTQASDTRMPDPGAIPLAAGAITAAGAVAAQIPPAREDVDSDKADEQGAERAGEEAMPGAESEKAATADDGADDALTQDTAKEIAEDTSQGTSQEVSQEALKEPVQEEAEEGPLPEAAALESSAGISPELGAPEETTLSDAEIFADLLAGQTAGADESAPRDAAEGDAPARDDKTSKEGQPEAPQPEGAMPEDGHPQGEHPQGEHPQEELARDAYAPKETTNEEFPEGDIVDGDSSVIQPETEPADEAREAPETPHHADAPESEADAEPEPARQAVAEPEAAVSAEEEVSEAAAEEPALAPEDLAVPPPSVIGTYESGGNTYTMYADGSIDAHTPDGDFHFASLDDLKRFIAEGGEGGGR
jgi:hypothetical protein